MALSRHVTYYSIAGAIGGLALGLYAWGFGCLLSGGLCASFWSDTKLFFPTVWPVVCAVAAGLSASILSSEVLKARPILLGLAIAVLTFAIYAIFHGLFVLGAGLPGIWLVLIVGSLYGGIPLLLLGALSGWAYKRWQH